MTRVGSGNYTPIQPPTTLLHILYLLLSRPDFFSPISGCLRVNYNPIQAPQTPPPSSLLVKIDTDDEQGKVVAGKTLVGWHHDGQKRAPCNFPVTPFDTSETSQSTLGPTQPLPLESILSPKMSPNFFFLICFSVINPLHFHYGLKCCQSFFQVYALNFFLCHKISLSIDLILSSIYRSGTQATHLLHSLVMLSSAPYIQPILVACVKNINQRYHLSLEYIFMLYSLKIWY